MSTDTKSTDLVVVNRLTGEQIDVRTADTEALGRFELAAQDVTEELRVSRDIVNQELVARLDRGLSWTLRLGDPRQSQVEITAPSPTAGTTTYPELLLERELQGLAVRGIVSEEGAAQALERKLVVTFGVPLDADLDELAAEAAATLVVNLGNRVLVVEDARPVRKSIAAGVRKLAKLPGTAAAIKRATDVKGVRSRKARVRLVERER